MSVGETLRVVLTADQGAQALPVIAVAGTLLIHTLAQRYIRWAPPMLLAALGGTALTWLVASHTGTQPESLEELPSALPPLSLPHLHHVPDLTGPAMVMSWLAVTEAMAIGKMMTQRAREHFNGNQELIGQGLANLAGSFFSSYRASGSFNRAGLNVAAGARTALAAVMAAGLLVVILFFVAPWTRWLPLHVTAALLLIVAWGLINVRALGLLWQKEPVDRLALIVTFLGTVSISLEQAILFGLTTAYLSRKTLQWLRSDRKQ
ncbi:SulP family inorganic anion transporter [Hydrogenophaga intermedia]|uniref:SulP family inorganic anion transporter n=1 Tax=Hydrogenophaga intermedia TaxID=65786 RepID=UPI002044C975|nr:SulP family inorganic anion transporter [Hydrogenophaga intermedia]MCM3564916.1 SulP family inorganic anion transporter [Hydrogenophaga intermedia]